MKSRRDAVVSILSASSFRFIQNKNKTCERKRAGQAFAESGWTRVAEPVHCVTNLIQGGCPSERDRDQGPCQGRQGAGRASQGAPRQEGKSRQDRRRSAARP